MVNPVACLRRGALNLRSEVMECTVFDADELQRVISSDPTLVDIKRDQSTLRISFQSPFGVAEQAIEAEIEEDVDHHPTTQVPSTNVEVNLEDSSTSVASEAPQSEVFSNDDQETMEDQEATEEPEDVVPLELYLSLSTLDSEAVSSRPARTSESAYVEVGPGKYVHKQRVVALVLNHNQQFRESADRLTRVRQRGINPIAGFPLDHASAIQPGSPFLTRVNFSGPEEKEMEIVSSIALFWVKAVRRGKKRAHESLSPEEIRTQPDITIDGEFVPLKRVTDDTPYYEECDRSSSPETATVSGSSVVFVSLDIGRELRLKINAQHLDDMNTELCLDVGEHKTERLVVTLRAKPYSGAATAEPLEQPSTKISCRLCKKMVESVDIRDHMCGYSASPICRY